MWKFILSTGLVLGTATCYAQQTDELLKESDNHDVIHNLDEKSIDPATGYAHIPYTVLRSLPLSDKSILISVTNTSKRKGVLTGTKNGKEIFTAGFKRNSLDGLWERRYNNSSLQDSGNMHNNIPDGEWLSWYEDGTLRSIRNYNAAKWFAVQREVKNRSSKIYFHNLSKDLGFNTRNFENFTRSAASFSTLPPSKNKTYEPPFRYCLHHGLYMNYYPNGVVKDSGYYKDGVKDGLWAEYYSDGKLSISGAYLNGVRHGGWKYFNTKGQLTMLAEFKNGKLIFKKDYADVAIAND